MKAKPKEKILGVWYTIGTKAWERAKQEVKLFNQLTKLDNGF